MTAFYIILAILLFGVLIVLHEFGHFITAKLSGVQVNEFSLFMGPAIWQKTKGETTYSLRCIPLGGYCAMEGEDGESENPRAFGNAKTWRKIVILVAGATMNFILGVLILGVFMFATQERVATSTLLSIDEGRPFYSETGLQPGDTFYKINGSRVWVNSDISMLLDRKEDGRQELVVIRDGEKVKVNVEMTRAEETGLYGMSFAVEDATFGNLMSETWHRSLDFTRLVWMGLGDLIGGRAKISEAGGPVAIVGTVVGAAKEEESVGWGIATVFYFFSFISINLAVMNLLPIPALDGGRVVTLLITLLIEKIIRRKPDPKYEAVLNAACFVLLLGFMAFITFKDIFQLFGG